MGLWGSKAKDGEGTLADYILKDIVVEEGGYPRISDIVVETKDYIEKLGMS